MNQQLDLLGARAVALERELQLAPRGRAVRRARPQRIGRGRALHRRAVSVAARG